MSAMPLLGTETEYGILAPQRPDVHPSVLSGLVVDGYSGAGTQPRLNWDGPVPIEDAHNRFLGNGARLYVDHAHPEYSTPEVTTARAALVAELAGDAIVVEGALAAGRALSDPVRASLPLLISRLLGFFSSCQFLILTVMGIP
jgi:proteasome accessory factor A